MNDQFSGEDNLEWEEEAGEDGLDDENGEFTMNIFWQTLSCRQI